MSCVCARQRNDDEAVVDSRGAHSLQGTNFEKEDLEGRYGQILGASGMQNDFASRERLLQLSPPTLSSQLLLFPRQLVHS